MLTLIIIFILSYVYWKWHTRRQPNEPPMLPGALPFIGHAHMLFLGDTKNFWEFVKYLLPSCFKMGHALFIYLGPFKVYVLTDPDDIYKVANTCFEKDQFGSEFTKDLLGNGLIFSNVFIWNRHRRLINPTFNQQILDGFLDVFNKLGRKLVTQLETERGKGYFTCTYYIRVNSMEKICITALDNSMTENEALKYIKLAELYVNQCCTRFVRLWLHSKTIYKYSSLKKEHDKCIENINKMSDSVLRKKRALRKLNTDIKTESDKASNGKVKVFMDLLMDLDNGALTDQDIRDELNTMMLAGQETVATVMELTLVFIGSYPDVQDKLYNELQEVLQDRDVEKQDLSRLLYLEAVIKECMRYLNVVPIVGRHIDREVQLKNYTLKPGNTCALYLHGINRSRQWGPDVDDFRPERWLDPASMPENPNLFAGFSLGRRNCIGKNYAMMSLKTGLSHLLRRYKIHADHTKLEMRLDFVLKPVSGNMILIEDRLNN